MRVFGGLGEAGRRENRGVVRGKDLCHATVQDAPGHLFGFNVVSFLKNLLPNIFEPFLLVSGGDDKSQLARGECKLGQGGVVLIHLCLPCLDPLTISNR